MESFIRITADCVAHGGWIVWCFCCLWWVDARGTSLVEHSRPWAAQIYVWLHCYHLCVQFGMDQPLRNTGWGLKYQSCGRNPSHGWSLSFFCSHPSLACCCISVADDILQLKHGHSIWCLGGLFMSHACICIWCECIAFILSNTAQAMLLPASMQYTHTSSTLGCRI